MELVDLPSSSPAGGLSLKTLSTSAPAVTNEVSCGLRKRQDSEWSTADAASGVRHEENMAMTRSSEALDSQKR